VAVSVEDWPDDIRLSDLEGRFTCSVCGHHCADIRPDWQSLP
jgi:rubrerythrin